MWEGQHLDDLILGRFRMIKLIEKTQKYKKFLLQDINQGSRVWMKVQKVQHPKPTVLHQAGFLQQFQGYPGFPLMIWSGNFTDTEMGLFTERLGSSLQQLMEATVEKHFSLETVCIIGLQIIKILQIMHEKHTILEEITPQNFRIDLSKMDRIVVSSLLHCKRYRSPKTLQVYKQKKLQHLQFFNQFLSFSKLSDFSCSRKDDLQSYFYLLIYLFKGSLPWTSLIKEHDSALSAKLLQFHKKKNINPATDVVNQLLDKLPIQFSDIFSHIIMLKFEQKPNYSMIRYKLQKVLMRKSKFKELIPEWIKFLPCMREPKLLQNINIYTKRDFELQQQFYTPFCKKIQLDKLIHIGGQGVGIDEVQYKEREKTKKKKHKRCLIM